MQPMADLASRFDRQDTPVARGRNCKQFDKRRMMAKGSVRLFGWLSTDGRNHSAACSN